MTLSILPNAVNDHGMYEVDVFCTITGKEAEDKRIASGNGTKNDWLLTGCSDSTLGTILQFLCSLILFSL